MAVMKECGIHVVESPADIGKTTKAALEKIKIKKGEKKIKKAVKKEAKKVTKVLKKAAKKVAKK